MRANPTLSVVDSSAAYKFWRNGAGDEFDTFNYLYSESPNSAAISSDGSLSGTAGHAGRIQLGGSSAYIRFDAEL